VVDELSTGILDAVLERGCPVRSLDHVNGTARGLNGRREWTKP
jgi:hypothetical protein